MRTAGAIVLVTVAAAALAASWLAPNDPNRRFDALLYAPPTRVHLFAANDGAGGPEGPPLRTVERPSAGVEEPSATGEEPSTTAEEPAGVDAPSQVEEPSAKGIAPPTRAAEPTGGGARAGRDAAPGRGLYIHPQRVLSLRERTFEEDRSRVVPLRWFADGRLVTADPEAGVPLLWLGADGFGRDIFSRLLHGARATLLLATIATLGATLLGALVGAVAGQSPGWVDTALSRATEFVLVLPAIYVAVSLRAVMPLVLSASTVFLLLAGIFTLLGWPVVARGVRAIVLAERERDYAIAARAAGAGRVRLLWRHLLPAASGYVLTQATLLFPAFILAEATMSFVGLGFPSDVATWGTMLRDAENVAALADAPWTLSPAAAIFAVVLGVNLFVQGSGHAPVQLEP